MAKENSTTSILNNNMSEDENFRNGSMTMNARLEGINAAEVQLLLPVLVIYVVIMTTGIIGNIFVLIIYNNKFKRSSSRVFILSLAAMDLLACVFGIPYHVLDLINPYTYSNYWACKCLSFIMTFFTLGSVFVLTVVGVDRFFKICRPLKKQVSEFGTRKACGIAILSSLLVSWPNALIYGHSSVPVGVGEDHLKGVECFIDDDYKDSELPIIFIGFSCFVFISTIVVLIVLYSLICHAIYVREKNQTEIFRSIPKSGLASADETPYGSSILTIADSVHNINRDEIQQDQGIPLLILKDVESQVDRSGEVALSETPFQGKKSKSVEYLGNIGDISKHANTTGALSVPKAGLLKSHPLIERSATACGSTNIITPSRTLAAERRRQSAPSTQKERSFVKSLRKLTSHTSTLLSTEKHTRKITKMMFTITLVFIVSYLPYLCIAILDAVDTHFWDDLSSSELVIYDMLLRTYLINNMANPIIYGFWDVRFRKECIQLIKAIPKCRFFGTGGALYSVSSDRRSRRTSAKEKATDG